MSYQDDSSKKDIFEVTEDLGQKYRDERLEKIRQYGERCAEKEQNNNDDGNGNGENRETIDLVDIQSKIPDKNYSEYVIGIIKRTVMCEDSLVRQIFYTCMSAYTKDPINLAIIAPTSEGKTYPVMEVTKCFPKEDVLNIGAMSTKALVRQRGIPVDDNKSEEKSN